MSSNLYSRVAGRWRRIASAIRIARARASGVAIGQRCSLGPNCDLTLGVALARQGQLVLGDQCELAPGVILHPYGEFIRIEQSVFVGPYTTIYGHGGISIGSGTLIAMHCRILSSNHTLAPFGLPIRSQPDVLRPTTIGRDVWLGAGVTVLGGVTIGDGCIVGAGAVVTKDLPAGSIAHGVPAEIKGLREGAPASGAPGKAK